VNLEIIHEIDGLVWFGRSRPIVIRAKNVSGQGEVAGVLGALAIVSIGHRFIGLRYLGVSVDRVSCKDASAEQGQKCRDCFNQFEIPLG